MKAYAAAVAIAVSLFLCLVPAVTFGTPIQFTHSGIGTGTIGTTSFVSANFTISAIGDTANREGELGPFGAIWIKHDSAEIAIAGLGVFQFVSKTRTFVGHYDSFNVVGFSRAAPVGGDPGEGFDLVDGHSDNVFANWEMLTSIGPVSGAGGILQWSGTYPPVITNAGTLVINEGDSPVTFTAVLLPESSTFALLAIGALGICLHRRRWLN